MFGWAAWWETARSRSVKARDHYDNRSINTSRLISEKRLINSQETPPQKEEFEKEVSAGATAKTTTTPKY